MDAEKRWTLAFGEVVGEWLKEALGPRAVRLEVVGSVRRQKETVGDVELLYIPRLEARLFQSTLFATGQVDQLADLVDYEIRRLMGHGLMVLRLNLRDRPIGYGVMNKMLVHVSSGMGVDVFRTSEENWGMAMVVRTGPVEWNKAMMTVFQRLGFQAHAYGSVERDGERIDCPTEERVFELLGIDYIEPRDRGKAGSLARLMKLGRR